MRDRLVHRCVLAIGSRSGRRPFRTPLTNLTAYLNPYSAMTSPILSVIEQQTRWATTNGLETRNAYVMSLTNNLRQEMSSGAVRDFERGSGSELRQRGIRPPRMHALRSSSALTVNVFDYWRSRDPRPLQRAFGLRDRITDRKSTRLNSSHSSISYAVFCLKK